MYINIKGNSATREECIKCSSRAQLVSGAWESSDRTFWRFFCLSSPTTLRLDGDPIKTVISVKTIQSLLRTLFSTPPILVLVQNVNCQSNKQKLNVIGCHWKEEVVRLIVQTSLIGTSIKQPIWSRPHPQLFPSPLPLFSKSRNRGQIWAQCGQVKPLFLPQIPSSPNQPPSPKSPPLLRESQPNLLTMQARRPRRGVDGRRWRKCPLKSAPLDHICTMVSMIVEAPKMQKKWNVAEGSKRNNKRNCSHLIFVWHCTQFWFC